MWTYWLHACTGGGMVTYGFDQRSYSTLGLVSTVKSDCLEVGKPPDDNEY